MKRIFDECQEFGVKVIFQILKTGFLTTFYRPEKRKEVVEKGRKRIQKDKKLGETEINILELISKNRKISIVQLSERLKISTTAIEKNIANLKRKGVLNRIGPAKGGYWEIVEEN